MKAAAMARGRAEPRRLLVVDPAAGRFEARALGDLATLLRPGDLVVVNDAATLPASLTSADGAVELRLLAAESGGAFTALAFGAGSWRMRTEDRPPPPTLPEGTALTFPGGLRARVVGRDARSERVVRVRFDRSGTELWAALYRSGAPVQYSHLRQPLALWDVQTAYASRPWAMEAPSAGLALTWELLLALRQRGVALAALTHAASLSSAGTADVDGLLPWEERFDIPSETVDAIAAARSRGGRVVAVGTTVVRALEGCAAQNGALEPGIGVTNLRIGPGFVRRVVDGILTGMHDPEASHYALLQSFAPLRLLAEAQAFAERSGFEGHEFGDSALALAGALSPA